MTTANSKDKPQRGRRHRLVGTVVSDKTAKTRVITVSRLVRHPKYEKIVRKRNRLDKILIELQTSADGPCDLRNFYRMGQTRPIIVPFKYNKDLCFIL